MRKKLMGIALAIVAFLGLSSAVGATTVKFLNEKNGAVYKTISEVYNNPAATIRFSSPTKNGYTFDKWATDDQLVVLENNTVRITGTNCRYIPFTTIRICDYPEEAIVYGTWIPTEYTIEYDLDGGVEPNPANPTSYNAETQTVDITDPTKEGYTFTGWLNDGGENLGTNFSFVPEVPYGNKTFTATWEEIPADEDVVEPTDAVGGVEQKATKTENKTKAKATKNPKTGINATTDIALLIIGLISFIGLIIYNPKKSN